ncbi:MAG: hypothetical protein Q4F49_02170 [Pseudoxanthomonas suwonensis]|nr:hypothetical protein [Pseudoxanthomonas suwonensis]
MSAKRPHDIDDPQARKRRRDAVRAALVLAVIAVGIYVAFIASGVLRA